MNYPNNEVKKKKTIYSQNKTSRANNHNNTNLWMICYTPNHLISSHSQPFALPYSQTHIGSLKQTNKKAPCTNEINFNWQNYNQTNN